MKKKDLKKENELLRSIIDDLRYALHGPVAFPPTNLPFKTSYKTEFDISPDFAKALKGFTNPSTMSISIEEIEQFGKNAEALLGKSSVSKEEIEKIKEFIKDIAGAGRKPYSTRDKIKQDKPVVLIGPDAFGKAKELALRYATPGETSLSTGDELAIMPAKTRAIIIKDCPVKNIKDIQQIASVHSIAIFFCYAEEPDVLFPANWEKLTAWQSKEQMQ